MSLMKITPKFVKSFFLWFYKRQFKFGLSDKHLTYLSEKFTYTSTTNYWDLNTKFGIGGWFEAPNTSGGYHGLLLQWWTKFGLGKDCLLISETTKVREIFQAKYESTNFVCTDYYTELLENAKTDVIWNLYHDIPEEFKNRKFDSVICQATFEHLLDPVGILKKFSKICNNGAFIYLHTHTPYYPKHSWPSDYLRYYPEWFFDVCGLIPNLKLVELHSDNGHVFALFKVNEIN